MHRYLSHVNWIALKGHTWSCVRVKLTFNSYMRLHTPLGTVFGGLDDSCCRPLSRPASLGVSHPVAILLCLVSTVIFILRIHTVLRHKGVNRPITAKDRTGVNCRSAVVYRVSPADLNKL
jgi:hypothetical protein